MSQFPDSNPYDTPIASSTPQRSPQWEEAKRRVSLPAIFLLILAPLSIPLAGLDFYGRMLAKPEEIPFVDQNDPAAVEQAAMGNKIFAGVDILHIVLQVVVIFGALQMKSLSSRSMAMTAAIIACIPCLSPACICGIPLGIWALVVMNDPIVQQAFDS